MVRTRSSARGFLYGDLEFERNCQQCDRQQNEQENVSTQEIDYAYSQNSNTSQETAYRMNDRCRRHRLPDNEQYTEQVTSYRRRRPR